MKKIYIDLGSLKQPVFEKKENCHHFASEFELLSYLNHFKLFKG